MALVQATVVKIRVQLSQIKRTGPLAPIVKALIVDGEQDMQNKVNESHTLHRTLALAGLAGGMAEVVWVALYCSVTPLSGTQVLRQITASFFPSWAAADFAPALGLGLHFALAVLVAYAFGLIVWKTFARRRGSVATLATSLVALAAIWTFNFFVLLPVVNAEFVGLMPYAVTLASKLLFGIAMAATLNASAVRRIVIHRSAQHA